MQSAEIELKFPVPDPVALEARLGALGFTLLTERTFEHNVLYDTADRALRSRHQILRLREYGSRCVLTHKRPPDGADDRQYKTRIETETTVDDCAAMREIFAQLGYEPAFTYDKFRTEWVGADSNGHLVIDETPIGTWAELEGDTAWIDAMLDGLGVDRRTCRTDSYGRLFELWRDSTASDAVDMTFEAINRTRPELAVR